MSAVKRPILGRLLCFFKMDITEQFTLSIIVVMTLTFLVSAKIIYTQQALSLHSSMKTSDDTVKKLFDDNKNEAIKSQIEKVNNLSRLLAAIAPSAIADYDLSSLANYVNMVRQDEDISYAAFSDKSGIVMAMSGNKDNVSSDNFVELVIEDDGLELGKVIIGYNYTRLDEHIKKAASQSKADSKLMTESGEQALTNSTYSMLISMFVSGLIVVAVLYWMFVSLVVRRLSILENSMKEIAEGDGDLTKRVEVKSKDAIDRVGEYFNLFLNKIHNAISRVNDASHLLDASSRDLSTITDETKISIDNQKTETDQVATAITEMAATVSEVSRNATDTASATNVADEQALDGRKIVAQSIEYIRILVDDFEETNTVITQLRTDSDSIGKVLDVIQGIAEQTNLLALNAAIEAARAGEQGRGFAVVADEVRTLAKRTQDSTTEIKSIIETLQAGVEKAVSAMDKGRQQVQLTEDKTTEAGTSLESITEAVAKINMMNTQIANAAEEQNAVAEEINQNITRISQHAEKTSSGAESTQMASTKLSDLSEELNTLMSQFKI